MSTPRITFAVFAYNQEDTIEATVRSAFNQSGEPLEILLSDDGSTDSTFDQMNKLAEHYTGPHIVKVRKNSGNLGISGHFNELVHSARGDLIIMSAGDDISLPDRAQKIAEEWDRSDQKLDLIASHLYDMDHDGNDVGTITVDDLGKWKSIEDWIERRPYIVGAAHAFTKRIFEKFGPLQPNVSYEDQINVFRAICSGGATTLNLPLVRYRRGGVSDRMREFSGEVFLRWLKRLNKIHVAVNEQWLTDARLSGYYTEVKNAIHKEYHRELFVSALLSAESFSARAKITLGPSETTLGWRIRKLVYVSFPGIAATAKRLQSTIKAKRKKQRR